MGGSEEQANKILENAQGKVLIIDEAYKLADGGYGQDVLDVIVERVNPDLCIILCGYEYDMKVMFEKGNAGLKSRFDWGSRVRFEDYDGPQLTSILMKMANSFGLHVTEDAAFRVVEEVLLKEKMKPGFGNGRAVEKLLEKARADRLMTGQFQYNKEGKLELVESDFYTPRSPHESALKKLESMCHMEGPLAEFKKLEMNVKFERYKAEKAGLHFDPSNFLRGWIFLGPPGTGESYSRI